MNKIAIPVFRTLTEGEILVDEDDIQDTFVYILSGKFKGERYHYDGSMELVEVYTKDDLIGLDVACTRNQKSHLRVSSVTVSDVAEFNVNVFLNNVFSDRLMTKTTRNLIRLLADENIKKQYKIDVLYKKSLRARIVVFLRNMSRKTDNSVFEINMDREQFAQYLGVNRSSLSHELSLMRQEGIINVHKGHFEILDEAMFSRFED
ncbi:MAG: Crp/Fnr family transcriptional regulator [Clostridiales Family XIII bacterium]|nr:Crp/Fnr family transcriptional regulator [Clostridiales Family XIII bacterium]